MWSHLLLLLLLFPPYFSSCTSEREIHFFIFFRFFWALLSLSFRAGTRFLTHPKFNNPTFFSTITTHTAAGRKQLWKQLGGGVSRCSNLVTESESRATVGAGEAGGGGRGGREPGGGSCRVELAGGRAVFSRDLNTSTTCLRFGAGEILNLQICS